MNGGKLQLIKSHDISICIPTFNRPTQLNRLLRSIEPVIKEIFEVVIIDNNSNLRQEVREVVNSFINFYQDKIRYLENDLNIGFDANVRLLISKAKGDYIVLIGDDDELISSNFILFLDYIKENPNANYFLRSWESEGIGKTLTNHKYFGKNITFDSGHLTFIKLFRQSVFISGFTFKRIVFKEFNNSDLDGTLLFQLYLLFILVNEGKSVYFETPIIKKYDQQASHFFGESDVESSLFTPGVYSIENDLNFIKNYIFVADYLEKKFQVLLVRSVINELSKYSYSILSLHRSKGIRRFIYFVLGLMKLGFGKDPYFYIYVITLIVFGTKVSNKLINFVRGRFKFTPSF